MDTVHRPIPTLTILDEAAEISDFGRFFFATTMSSCACRFVIICEMNDNDVWFPQKVVEANVVRGDSLLKAWREYRGLTQAEVAARAGMSQPAYARLEKPSAQPRVSFLSSKSKTSE